LIGIRHAAGFYDDMLRRSFELAEAEKRGGKTIYERTADTAVGEINGIAILTFDEVGINVDVAKVVDDDGKTAVCMADDMVEDCRFSCAVLGAENGVGER